MAGIHPPPPPPPPPPASGGGGRQVQKIFTAFYEDWLTKQEDFQEKLLECLEQQQKEEEEGDGDDKCTKLIEKVLNHYKEFFNEKCKAAKDDAFIVMSPPWFTSLERALLWISAFKPSLLFPVIKKSPLEKDLSPHQKEKIDGIRVETRKLEKELEEKLAKVQERVAGGGNAAATAFELLRRYERLVDGEISELDTRIDELKESMIMVMENADRLRELTAKKIMEVLKPLQNVKFLIAFGQFLIQIRRLGTQKDAQRAI